MSSPKSIASLDGTRILILGGTGSLGRTLFRRISTGEFGAPDSVVILSRDEAKQHFMRLDLLKAGAATDDIIYKQVLNKVKFVLGDVRNYSHLRRAVADADVIFHAAALKQVPSCEYYPDLAIDTNVYGAINLVRAINESARTTKHVVGVSTDKACKPVNVMGMTKALQERVIAQGNITNPWARFVNVRYGNVMASRGSAIPFFLEQIRSRLPIPITDVAMTRYLMTLDQAVDLIFAALRNANSGETYIPRVPCAKMTDVVLATAEADEYPTRVVGIRPGEKLHEILISEEEVARTVLRGEHLVIKPILPELMAACSPNEKPYPFTSEYSSSLNTLDLAGVRTLLKTNRLTVSTAPLGQEIYT